MVGDSIRWYGIFRDVDLRVRYIHDILKVDVIVKAALMNDIRADVRSGKLNADEYLTARFDIPNIWVNGEARQGGEPCDLYAERLDVQQPVEFVKDGKVVQKLRPVETHMLDAKGEPIVTFDEKDTIRSAQSWRLKKDAPGVAEMSAYLGDLAKAPEGDVVIDPSMQFGGQPGDYGYAYDSYLDQSNPTTSYGSLEYLTVGGTTNAEKRILLGFSTEGHLDGRIIFTAKLRLNMCNYSGSPNNHMARSYKITNNWNESTVTWSNSSGGLHDTVKYYSKSAILPNYIPYYFDDRWVVFDVTYALKSHFATNTSDTINKGFLVKMVSLPISNTTWSFLSSDYSNPNYIQYRPELVVEYGSTKFGAWGGNADAELVDNIEDIYDDKLFIVRITAERPGYGYTDSFMHDKVREIVYAIYNQGLKALIVIPAGWNNYPPLAIPPDIKGYANPTDYANYITALLVELSEGDPRDPDVGNNYIENGTVIAIEIGSEEDSYQKYSDGITYRMKWTKSTSGYASETGGREFATYYLAAYDAIKNNSSYNDWKKLLILSGSIEDWKQVAKTGGCSSKDFLRGYLDEITDLYNNDKLPDAISYHTYTGKYSPESKEFSSGYPLYYKLGEEITNMCMEEGFIPNLAQTEYGFSPTSPESTGLINDAAPSDIADSYTQAIYYLRSRLLQGCMYPIAGVGNIFSIYFIHEKSCRVLGSGICDWSFLNFDSGLGTERIVRYLARELMETNENLCLGSDFMIWLPVTAYSDYHFCGSKSSGNSSLDRWLVIWRYGTSVNYFDGSPGDSRTITIFGDYKSDYKSPAAYRFTLNKGTKYNDVSVGGYFLPYWKNGSAEFDHQPSITVTSSTSGGSTTFSVSGVTENPTFIFLEGK